MNASTETRRTGRRRCEDDMSCGAGPKPIGGHLRTIVVAALVGLATTIGGARAADETPYDDVLADLAETLGALHLLRPLCGAPEPQTWREQMTAVIDSVQPSKELKARMIDRFNQSYRGLAAVHHECTPAARALSEIYRKRGEDLGRELVSRWGHP